MKNSITATSLILGVLSLSTAAMAVTTLDCTQKAIAAGVIQYKADNKDLAYDVSADSAEQTTVAGTAVIAYSIPLHQFDGQLGCGIGVTEIVVMDSQCKVLSQPVESN